MMTTLALPCLWFIAALISRVLPSRKERLWETFALIAVGVPILGILTWQHGPSAGFLALGAGATLLRRPPLDEVRHDHPAYRRVRPRLDELLGEAGGRPGVR